MVEVVRMHVGALIVGFDAMDADLMQRWCDSGAMPVLASLRQQGVWGTLSTPPGLGDDSSWASFYTGVWPGRHGRYSYQTLKNGSYRTDWHQDADLLQEPFWCSLQRQGRRLAVLDVPKSPVLPAGFDGVGVSDFRVHGADHLQPSSQPPALIGDLVARYGLDETDTIMSSEYWCHHMDDDQMSAFIDRTHRSLAHKLTLSQEVLQNGVWDLFMTVFKEAHCAGHQLWGLHDAAHGRDDPLLAVYQALDTGLGQLLLQIPPDTPVLVFSDLGMGPNYSLNAVFDAILLAWEEASESWLRRPCRQLWTALEKQQKGWDPRRDGVVARRTRRVFTVEGTDVAAALRLNLRGREPHGTVSPGRESDTLCRDLETLAACLTDELGRPVCGPVLYADQVFPGPARDRLPDMLIPWRCSDTVRRVHASGLGTFANLGGGRPGTHRTGGFFVARGPGLGPNPTLVSAALVDLAPTLATWVGAALPDVDGKPVDALLLERPRHLAV